MVSRSALLNFSGAAVTQGVHALGRMPPVLFGNKLPFVERTFRSGNVS